MKNEFEKAYIAYAGTPIPCLLCDGFSAESDKKRLQKFFELGQQSAKPLWILGIPERKYANFLLKVKPDGSKYEHIVKGFYAQKLQIDANDPNGEYDPEFFDMDEHEEYYLVEGFYEDAQLYCDESGYCKIPEKDIIAYQPLPEV